MKRPPGIWLLLTTVFVWMCIEEVYSLKATSLIFAKTTTTTTTKGPDSESDATDDAAITESSVDDQNSTKHTLTGNPQIDYIWDPNLPRELNGYNLSDYPFYDRVPEDIKFKCDGLHDGFYASVVHKCQVYHHCLFGTRYDFLCANYTAFDQKTFICHFVSEVDCVNSKKFWHRNDALYQAASTTTVKPITVNTLPPVPATSVPIVPILNRRKLPARRRRPQYDYYEYDRSEDEEEYYDEPRRRLRPRYRPRPLYEDDYEYEDDTYDRGRRREEERRYNRRGSHDRRYDDRRSGNRRNKDDRRKQVDADADADDEYEDDYVRLRRPNNDRRSTDDRRERRPNKRRKSEVEDDYGRGSSDKARKGNRRPIDEDYDDKPLKNDRRSHDRPRKNKDDDDRRFDRPRNRDDDEEQQNKKTDRPRKKNEDEDTRRNERPQKTDDESDKKHDHKKSNDQDSSRNNENTDNDKPLTKAPSSVYDRPRHTSRIRLSVPKSEQTKHTYKTTTKSPVLDDEEYYDDYDDDTSTIKKIKSENETRRPLKLKDDEIANDRGQVKHSTRRDQLNKMRGDDNYDNEKITRRPNKQPKYEENKRTSSNSRKRPVIEDYEEYDDGDDDKSLDSKSGKNDNKRTTTALATTKDPPRERSEPVVKVVKRPFLPSRGGNPYASRGLQPVGTKALETNRSRQIDTERPVKTVAVNEETKHEDDIKPLKQTPVVIKIPVKTKYNAQNDDVFRHSVNRPSTRQNYQQQITTTEKPKIIKTNPLDIDEDEYDVTLNDALNPTLPNLPIRSFPTGFSASTDYYNNLQRSRYVADPSLNQASSNYVYRVEQPVQKLEQNYNHFPNSENVRYIPNTPIYQNFKHTTGTNLAHTYYPSY